ncbi:uncharacterized protein LOC101462267 isoform X2 [Ceratitis capitata]|uniref:uncharacterized protein LOC101462267 isoform X2 n=1 Tax=Ceratitis capitata TaxID=7213 RepID=UPI00032A2EEA|nr:uncharacterized protein LOC101462267 isoform X2 [Ceratitis capitata]
MKYDATVIKLPILGLLALSVTDLSEAIKCFKCSVTPETSDINNVTSFTPMCTKFDASEEFKIDCPFSTMCIKIISTLQLQNDLQNTVTRGCAPQKDTKQVFKNRRWQQEHSVQEVYDEGCIDFTENHLTPTVKTYCYCRGDLCNSGPKTTHADLYLIALIFCVIYYKL